MDRIEPVGSLPGFDFASRADAAAKLSSAAKQAGVILHRLPYSRYEPEGSTWWLSPTTANPAYSVGKVVVEGPTIVNDGAALIGLHVEKGVGPAAAAIFEDSAAGRRLVTRPDWLWPQFLQAFQDGTIAVDLGRARRVAADLPLMLELVASRQFPPNSGNPHGRDPDGADRIRFELRDDRLIEVARRTGVHLNHVPSALRPVGFAQAISAIPELDWVWVEVLVGIPFTPDKTGGMGAAEVWRVACEPWLRWVK